MPSSYTKKDGKDRKGNQKFTVDPKKIIYNIDTLWLNADAANYDDVMNSGLRDRLLAGREHSYDSDDFHQVELNLFGYDSPLIFDIMPGQKPLYFSSIRNDDVAIYFSKQKPDSKSLPMKIQLNQFILWDKGVELAFTEALMVLAALGFVPGQCKLNRIDFACHSDQFQWTLEDLKTFTYPENIAKDNKPNFFRLDPCTGEFETVYFGDRTKRQMRIYNKSLEAVKKKKTHFLALYKKLGMNPDKVWNIEIELRRDWIKECKDLSGLCLFDDFELVLKENRLADLWSYLMTGYGHDSAFWTQYSKGDPDKKFYKVDGFNMIRQKDIDKNFEREVAQIAGRLELAVLNEEDKSLENALRIFTEKLEERGVDWEEKVVETSKKVHSTFINSTINKFKLLKEAKTVEEMEAKQAKRQAVEQQLLEKKIIKKEPAQYADKPLISYQDMQKYHSEKQKQLDDDESAWEKYLDAKDNKSNESVT